LLWQCFFFPWQEYEISFLASVLKRLSPGVCTFLYGFVVVMRLLGVKQEQLIGDNHKLVLLAALSDSLDFVSESVQQ
jgi:hypothetical protein